MEVMFIKFYYHFAKRVIIWNLLYALFQGLLIKN